MIGFAVHLPPASRILAEMISMERLRELQRFAEVGRVSAGLIHDMSSPLTAAILHLEQDGPGRLPSIRNARRSIRVLERYIEAARRQLSQQDQAVIFSAKQEVDQAEYILRPLARRRHVQLRFSFKGGVCDMFGDPIKFQRIIINLATNAMDAYQGLGGDKRPVRVLVTTNGRNLVIQVLDRGKGIPTEQLPRLFEPFYTTKQPGAVSGLGIGLSTTRQYVEKNFNGTITAASSAVKGTRFQVKLPLRPDKPSR